MHELTLSVIMKKRHLLTLIILASLICLTKSSFGQENGFFEQKEIYAIGDVTELSDSIIFIKNFSQIDSLKNYTTLYKISKNKYKIFYWLMENGGIVDPTIVKDNLKIIRRSDSFIILKIFGIKKEYKIINQSDKNGDKIQLKKNNNR